MGVALFKLLFAAFLTFSVLSPSAHADIVRLKTGKILEGTVTQESEASVSIDLGKASVKVPRSRVDWVIRGERSQIERKAKAGQAFLLGVAALKSYDYKKAALHFEEAKAFEPNDRDTLANLAYAYARSGMPAKAALLYGQALQIDPANRDLRMNLVSAYVDTGQFKDAAAILHRMLRDFPRERGLYEKLSLVFHKAGLYTQSVLYAKKASKLPVS